jgi:chemotaxis family two-component system response regulator Rcp1
MERVLPATRACPSQPVEILLVEDSPGDIRLLQEAFKEFEFAHRMSVVRDGEQAMAFLRREGLYADCPRPALILLDLHLPRKNGREVLAEIKGRPHLRQIPVVILSTSTNAEDIRGAYDLHANCYVPKPADLGKLVALGRMIQEFWFTAAVLPVTEGPAP